MFHRKLKFVVTKSIENPEEKNPSKNPSRLKRKTAIKKTTNRERRARVCRPANGSVICVRTVMGKATDANGGCFAMKLSCRIKGRVAKVSLQPTT